MAFAGTLCVSTSPKSMPFFSTGVNCFLYFKQFGYIKAFLAYAIEYFVAEANPVGAYNQFCLYIPIKQMMVIDVVFNRDQSFIGAFADFLKVTSRTANFTNNIWD